MKKIFIIVLMAILLTGCGKKSPPVPPQMSFIYVHTPAADSMISG